MKVELEQQVVDVVRRCAPEPRRALRAGLRIAKRYWASAPLRSTPTRNTTSRNRFARTTGGRFCLRPIERSSCGLRRPELAQRARTAELLSAYQAF